MNDKSDSSLSEQPENSKSRKTRIRRAVRTKPKKGFIEQNQKRLMHCVLLVVVSGSLWMIGAFGEFLWLDRVEIIEGGYRIRSVDEVSQVWTSSLDAYLERDQGQLETSGGYLRPVYATSISIDWWLWGENPMLYKMANIFWHCLVVVGLYLLGVSVFFKRKIRSDISLAAAMIFAVHPFAVHSVTWISGRKDTMCAAFALISLIAFGVILNHSLKDSKHQESATSKRKSSAESKTPRWWIWFTLMIVGLGTATFCKELALITPLFATIWFWFAIRKRFSKLSLAALLAMWATVFASAGYRIAVLGSFGLNTEYPSSNLLLGVVTSARLIFYYVFRIFLPRSPTIVDRWRISESLGAAEFGCALLLLAVLGLGIYLIVKRRETGLALTWFAVWMIPTCGIVPLRHMYAERYLYPASWGLFLLVVLLLLRVPEKFKRYHDALPTALIVIVLGLAFLSAREMRYWESNDKLFKRAVRQNSSYVEGLSARALQSLEKQNYDEAITFSERAIESAENPTFGSYFSPQVIYMNLGIARYQSGDILGSKADFERALESRPNNSIGYYHLAKVSVHEGEVGKAVEYFQTALSLKPDDHICRNDLGNLLLNIGRYEESTKVLEPAIAAEPDNVLPRANLGAALIVLKKFGEAEPHFQKLVELDPENPVNIAKLAWCKFELGDKAQGWELMRKAFAINPDDPTVITIGRMYRE